MDRIFAALADPTRRDVVARVLTRDASASVLAERYAMSFAAVQRHIAVLQRAGLVRSSRTAANGSYEATSPGRRWLLDK